MIPQPTLAVLREKVAVFAALPRPDQSFADFRRRTGDAPDLSREDHRSALLDRLNRWGCRIRRPRVGESRPFDRSVQRWWTAWQAALPPISRALSELSDDEVTRLSEAFPDLADSEVAHRSDGRVRTLGPTASAKTLYALRPRAVMPWDAAIGGALHGGRGAGQFAEHLRLGRSWARALLDEAGEAEDTLVTRIGRPGLSLAKVLDEYCYVVGTLRR